MNIICTSLVEELQNDFSQARAQLAGARLRQALKDTPADRAAVAECRAQIDAILDIYLELREFDPEVSHRRPEQQLFGS